MRNRLDLSRYPISLYYYFDSKEEIVKDLFGEFIEQIMGRLSRAVSDQSDALIILERLIRETRNFISDRPSLVSIMYNDWPKLRGLPDFERLNRSYSRISGLWIAQIEQGARDGVFRSDLDPGLMYRSIQASLVATARWYVPSGPLKTEDLLAQQLSLFVDGLKAVPAAAD